MTYRKNLALLSIVALLFFASSCEKWRNNRETLTSENHTLAEASFLFIFHHALLGTTPEGALIADSCFTPARSGNTLTIDFGSEGCTAPYGSTAYGKIIATLSDSFHLAGAVMNLTADHLYVNGFHVEGDVTIMNMGLDTAGKQQYHLKVENGTITGKSVAEEIDITWQGEYHLVLMQKNNAALSFDDLFSITGNASGVNNESRGYTATITESLLKYTDCRWPGAGKTKITPDELKERDLFYGECTLTSACCDNVAIEEAKWPDRTVRME